MRKNSQRIPPVWLKVPAVGSHLLCVLLLVLQLLFCSLPERKQFGACKFSVMLGRSVLPPQSEQEGLVRPCPVPQRNKAFPYPVREKKSILFYGSPHNISNTSASVIRPTVKQGQLVRDVRVLKRLLGVLASFWEPHITG